MLSPSSFHLPPSLSMLLLLLLSLSPPIPPPQYLSTPESLHQIPEIIRFICCVIHPTNEVLASDIIPRWALIGWLLSLSQSNPVVFNNAKLALFYDWFAYNPETDNIMNIGKTCHVHVTCMCMYTLH